MRFRFAFALLLLAPFCHAQETDTEVTERALEALMQALEVSDEDSVTITFNNDLSDPSIKALFDDFASEMEARMMDHDFAVFDDYFLKDTLVDRAMIPSSSPAHFMFNTAFRLGMLNGLSFEKEFGLTFPEEMLYSHLQTQEEDGKVHVLFRMYSEYGLNYHDLEMASDGERVYILDMLPYATGENMSTTIQGPYISGLSAAGVDLDDLEGDHLSTADLEVWADVHQALGDGKYKKALSKAKKFSPESRDHPLIHSTMGLVYSNTDIDKYLRYIKDIDVDVQHTGAMMLHSLDVLAVNERFEEMSENIEKLNTLVGGDPILHIYRGYVHMYKGELTACLDSFLDVVQAYPDSPYGYDAVVQGHMILWDLEGAMDVVETMHTKLGLSKENLRNRFRDYPDLLKTNRFRTL